MAGTIISIRLCFAPVCFSVKNTSPKLTDVSRCSFRFGGLDLKKLKKIETVKIRV